MSLAVPNPAWKRVRDFLSQSVPSRQGNTPAAAFVLIEADGAQGELDNAGLIIDHDNATGAEHRSCFADLVEVHAEVFDLFGQKNRCRRTAGNYGFQFASAAYAAAHLVDHFLQVVAHRQFIHAGPLNVAADCEQPRPAIAGRADRANAAPPIAMTCGTVAMVSALLMTVGPP